MATQEVHLAFPCHGTFTRHGVGVLPDGKRELTADRDVQGAHGGGPLSDSGELALKSDGALIIPFIKRNECSKILLFMALIKTSTMRIAYQAAVLFLFLETMSSTFPSCEAGSGDICFHQKHCKLSMCSVKCASMGCKGIGARCMRHKHTVTMECCCKIKNNGSPRRVRHRLN
ncbi:hypothetical protein SETIT_8G142100v2 [Setaria italica]|uniref:Uncharacterized protein n=1 Tax=Setaria italica TaxID=4555 RepID=A0A368S7M5_SETIT|nr:hypothetical protein SETIT_8G142100v2 [Setaria italica]